MTRIIPPHGLQLVNIRELWQFRELIFFLAWRDVKVRYKQTVLGAAWAVLQPALMMVVFTIFFRRMAGVPSGNLPYPLFAYAGLLPWTFFATAITNAGNSVIGSERVITKIYFPRLAIPFASVGAAVVDFVVAFVLLLAMMAYYGIAPGWGMLLVPLIYGMMVMAALGLGTLLAALNVAYRDFRYVIPFMVQIGLFATPSVYMQTETAPAPTAAAVEKAQGASAPASGPANSSAPAVANNAPQGGPSRLPRSALLKGLLALNPMTPLISAFRAAVLGGTIPWLPMGIASLSGVVMFVAGCLYFRKVEDAFADII